jgi:galactose-1-phosphate uridylyltransferase
MTCLFRKGLPTIALRQDKEVNYALCALCLHPIGYYGDTWYAPDGARLVFPYKIICFRVLG